MTAGSPRVSVLQTLESAIARLCAGDGGLSHITGVRGSAGPCLAARAVELGRTVLYVAADERSSADALLDLSAFLAPSEPPLPFPGPELGPYEKVRPDRRWTQLRAASLAVLSQKGPRVLVTTPSGFLSKTVPKEVIAASTHRCEMGAALSIEELAARLSRAGYGRVDLVEDPATFALRGEIVDLWSPGYDAPHRIELAFDEVSSIRPFDPESQRSERTQLESLLVFPAQEAVLTPEATLRAQASVQQLCDAINLPSSKTRLLLEDIRSGRSFFSATGLLPAYYPLVPLTEHLPQDALVMFEGGERVAQAVREVLQEAETAYERLQDEPRFPVGDHYLTGAALERSIEGRAVVALHSAPILGSPRPGFFSIETPNQDAGDVATRDQTELAERLRRSGKQRGGDLRPLLDALRLERDQGHRMIITARSLGQADRLSQLLAHHGFSVDPGRDVQLGAVLERERSPGEDVELVVCSLRRGFSSDLSGLFLLSEEEVFGRRKPSRPRNQNRALRDATNDLGHLAVGDYVVHREHGIGRYLGLVHRTVEGVLVDLIGIEFSGGDKLYLPVYRLSQVQRYSGAETAPRLDRLGGQTFAKTKKQAGAKVRDMADQLLSLYAARKSMQRPPVSTMDDDYLAFCAGFPFEETPDQAAAILDVETDLSSDHVMDRLVCGDVGFGKTEVALRATYLSVLAGRQVALLCPTTVLAQQHYRTFQGRLTELGVRVAVMSRFQSKAQVESTVAGLKKGEVDVVVGTHRLLSSDVHFKNLGLLVIDEEQRFGVVHKERIRKLRQNVDVLTLTATPIPRTLSLSVGGVRDMSVIMTPPVDRRAIRTLLGRYDETIVRDAVTRELERGGQVYYVHNRAQEIEARASVLARLLPGAKIGIGHGQMTERQLEKAMLGFVEGRFDVLVATTIVESGLDIPRANTMIIERADQFGLAQLYQLRGRVGRSAERAYCYLMLPPDAPITDEAAKRLEALERYTELGSGFHIATLDMELRGAGELLGQDQSGLLPRIGFELFSQMLEQATTELAGNVYVPEIDPELSLDLEALLPEDYIEEVGIRLSLYKRFAAAESEDEVVQISEEMEDRFGAPPPEVRAYEQVMRLKTKLRGLRALGLNATRTSVTIHLRADTPIAADRLAPLVAAAKGKYQLRPDGRLTRKADQQERFSSGLEHATRMLNELDAIASTPAGS